MSVPHNYWKTKIQNPPVVLVFTERPSEAEVLLTNARVVMALPDEARQQVLRGMSHHARALVKLGNVLDERVDLAFRAIVEGWDRERIVREVYQ